MEIAIGFVLIVVVVTFIILSIFYLFDVISHMILNIQIAKSLKQYKGNYIICYLDSECKDISFIYELNEKGWGANQHLENAIKFKDQKSAIDYLKKYYDNRLFVIQI